ncbi:MAG: MFS transporter [Thiohalocapsa sp.]
MTLSIAERTGTGAGARSASGFHFAILFTIATLLLIYQVYVSLSFGLILKPMSADLGMTSATASLVSAIFMLSICVLQLPAGLAVDRYKPGLVLALATLVCAAGTALLGLAESVSMAFAGRIVMGLGSAFAFVGALKIVGLIVPRERFTVTIGVWQILYSLIVAGLAYASGKLGLENDWRGLMFGLSVVGIGVAVLLWMSDIWLPRTATETESTTKFWTQLREVVTNREILLAAVIFGLAFGPLLAYSDLWAIPDQLAWRHSFAQAAAIAGMIPIGMGVGSLVIGVLVDRYNRPRAIGAVAALIGFLATTLLLFAHDLPNLLVFFLSFLFGFGTAASLIALAHARVFASAAQMGSAVGLVSAVGYLVGAVLQAEIGLLMDQMHVPQVTSYQFADGLSPLLQCFLLAAILMAVMKAWPAKTKAQA